MEKITELLDKAKHSSPKPGVYLMQDQKDRILYVGKAKNLRNRLKSYFQSPQDQSPKTQVLVSKIKSFETIITDTEAEALILECNLIKKHKPRYNIRLRDDKNFPYLKIDLRRDFPIWGTTRKVVRSGERYFGPYVRGSARGMVRFINKVFKLRDCTDTDFYSRTRPCLNFDMGICTAPCVPPGVGGIDQNSYQAQVEKSILFASGKTTELLKLLTQEMEEASQNLLYEKAAAFRDQIQELENFQNDQKVMDANSVHDWDVVGFYKKDEFTVISLLIVRGGALVGKRNFKFPGASGQNEEILTQFLTQYYEENVVPKRVMLPIAISDRELLESHLQQFLEEGVKFKVHLEVPKRGVKNEFVEMANENAKSAVEEALTKEKTMAALLIDVKEKLHLTRFPEKIECYDNSNFQGDYPVGSRVVFINGKPDKNFYRRYHIKTVVGPDDFASMREVLSRRFSISEEYKKEDPFPDLLLVDGGAGQLAIAKAVLDDLGISEVEVAGIAKARTESEVEGVEVKRSRERIFRPGRSNPILLDPHSPVCHLLERVRNEAHRFAITFHRKTRDEASLKSVLDEIQGVSVSKKTALLKKFGSIEGIKEASVEALSSVEGVSPALAQKILEALN